MSRISDAVVDDLTFDPDVDVSGITVEDRDGEVVLAGSVPSYPQYRPGHPHIRRRPGHVLQQRRLAHPASPRTTSARPRPDCRSARSPSSTARSR
jgi:hypothetical protein